MLTLITHNIYWQMDLTFTYEVCVGGGGGRRRGAKMEYPEKTLNSQSKNLYSTT